MPFGIPLAIFNSIPKWMWFYDNVIFWFQLWFTNKFKGMDSNSVSFMKKNAKSNKHQKQWKVIEKKYNY